MVLPIKRDRVKNASPSSRPVQRLFYVCSQKSNVRPPVDDVHAMWKCNTSGHSTASTCYTDSRGSSRESSRTCTTPTPVVPSITHQTVFNSVGCPNGIGHLTPRTTNSHQSPTDSIFYTPQQEALSHAVANKLKIHPRKHIFRFSCFHFRRRPQTPPQSYNKSPSSISYGQNAATQTLKLNNVLQSNDTTVSRATSFYTAVSDADVDVFPSTQTRTVFLRQHESPRDPPWQAPLPNGEDQLSSQGQVSTSSGPVSPEGGHTDPASTPHKPPTLCQEELTVQQATFSSLTTATDGKHTPYNCTCGHPAHSCVYDPELPLFTGPCITQGSYAESLAIAKACCGRWVTILERSESLDTQYRHLGLGPLKRAVMNRMAIPLTMFLEDDDTVLHCWIHTPLGTRHMRSSLLGEEVVDEDTDVGIWRGVTQVVNYSIPWYCNGTPVRALQQVRQNSERGLCIETRCILPDAKETKVMLFNFSMIPRQTHPTSPCPLLLSADRILRQENT